MPKKSTGRGRGRPAFRPTPAVRMKVSIAAGGGMRHEDIAIALGISRETLEKYFEVELSTGASARRMEVLAGLHKAGKRGSSGAAKAYLALEPQLSAPPTPAPAEGAAAPATVKESPKGKKEQAQEDAQTAHVGTDWNDLLRKSPAAGTVQ